MLGAEALDGVFVCTPPAAHLAPRPPRSSAASPSTSRSRSPGRPPTARPSSRRGGERRRLRGRLPVAQPRRARPRPRRAGRRVPGLLVCRSLGPAQRGRSGDVVRATRGRAAASSSSSQATTSTSSGPSPARSRRCRRRRPAGSWPRQPPARLTSTMPSPIVMRFAGGGLGMVALGWTDAQQPPVYSLDVMAADVALRLDLAGPGRVHGRSHGADVDSAGGPTRAAHRSRISWRRSRAAARRSSPARRRTRSGRSRSCWRPSGRSRPASGSPWTADRRPGVRPRHTLVRESAPVCDRSNRQWRSATTAGPLQRCLCRRRPSRGAQRLEGDAHRAGGAPAPRRPTRRAPQRPPRPPPSMCRSRARASGVPPRASHPSVTTASPAARRQCRSRPASRRDRQARSSPRGVCPASSRSAP